MQIFKRTLIVISITLTLVFSGMLAHSAFKLNEAQKSFDYFYDQYTKSHGDEMARQSIGEALNIDGKEIARLKPKTHLYLGLALAPMPLAAVIYFAVSYILNGTTVRPWKDRGAA